MPGGWGRGVGRVGLGGYQPGVYVPLKSLFLVFKVTSKVPNKTPVVYNEHIAASKTNKTAQFSTAVMI